MLFIYLDFCVSSLFLHLCSISLPFHYFSFNLRSPFPRLEIPKVEFFLPFSFCPPKVGPVVCVSFVQGEIFVLFVCLFFLRWARLSEVVILSADELLCIFLLFVD